MLAMTIPASTANLGPGFDSIGMALDRYLHVDVERSDSWSFHCDNPGLENLGPNNLIYQAAAFTAKHLETSLLPCRVSMKNDIPLSKGFGSSAAAIVAGIEIACYCADRTVSQKEKVRIGSLFEGHPDNVAPSIYGGLIVGAHRDHRTDIIHVSEPKVELVALIPPEILETKKARGILPKQLQFKQAIQTSALSNVMTAAILADNWSLAGELMMEDLYHQPYRKHLIPHWSDIMNFVKDHRFSYGAALSGAGPTVLCFVEQGSGKRFAKEVQRRFPYYQAEVARPATVGTALSVVQA